MFSLSIGEESETEEVARVDNAHPSDDEDAVEGEDLLARLQRIVARKGVLCEQEHPAKVRDLPDICLSRESY